MKDTQIKKDKKILNEDKKDKEERRFFSGSSPLIFVIFLFVGLVVAIQLKTIDENKRKIDLQKADLLSYLNQLEAIEVDSAHLSKELDELKIRKDNLIEKTLVDLGYTSVLDELMKINALAGFTEIRGRGVTVTLNDMLIDDPKFPAVTSVIHDADIRQVIDIMKSAGAKGIAVNGERLVSTSELTCNGPTVQINKKKFPVPYVITCVGNPTALYLMLTNDEWLNERLLSNIDLKIEINEDIVIPAFSDQDNIKSYIDSLGMK